MCLFWLCPKLRRKHGNQKPRTRRPQTQASKVRASRLYVAKKSGSNIIIVETQPSIETSQGSLTYLPTMDHIPNFLQQLPHWTAIRAFPDDASMHDSAHLQRITAKNQAHVQEVDDEEQAAPGRAQTRSRRAKSMYTAAARDEQAPSRIPATTTTPLRQPQDGSSPVSYHQIYVSPRSMAHLSFPVVDYSAGDVKSSKHWPRFYMAVAPKCSTLADLRATLTPKGSGTHLTARRLEDANTIQIDQFQSIFELRCNIIQLEILDDMVGFRPEDGEHGQEKDKRDGAGIIQFHPCH